MAIATGLAGEAPAHQIDQLAVKRFGLWLFFFSETLLFSLLLGARFFLEGIERGHLDQLLGLGITSILLASSLSAFVAEASMERGNQRGFVWGMAITILLGVVFAVGVGFEWTVAEFSRQEPFGTVFFSMTGVHAAHVISGVLILAMVLAQGLRGRFSAENHWPVSATVTTTR